MTASLEVAIGALVVASWAVLRGWLTWRELRELRRCCRELRARVARLEQQPR